ncbi:MAG: ribose-phosphate pyrophosphokinase [Isosphaeraceae bacterium]|nr:ribose-phosphate pyrophosphokinase [Isosphaeraceae bacterium]
MSIPPRPESERELLASDRLLAMGRRELRGYGAGWETMMGDFVLFAGTANPPLATATAAELGVRLGACFTQRFPDGETAVRLDEPVRGRDVFLVQPTAPPVNDHLVELLALADACRRSAAGRITAVVPYFGYARSDKRHGRREPITASLVARMIQAAGIDHVLTLDLHAAQIEGFFQIPVDALTAVPTLTRALRDRLSPDTVVVSPDTGRVKTATDFAHRLNTTVVVLHKRRTSGTETEVTHVVGDVAGRACLIIDDMISTGGTIARAVEAVLAAGARPEITVAATHGLFVGEARRLLAHEAVRAVVVTDTVACAEQPWPLLEVVSVAPLLAEAIRRLRADGSLGDLY